ncbi:MAG: hypothetical protein L0207_00780 [Chlamydiae bacterium]|nr:hypothetical protein [Chlamydiota bacterium]
MRKFFLILTVLIATALEGKENDQSEKIKTWMPEEIVSEKISSYFSSHDLSPYIYPELGNIRLGFIPPVIENDKFFRTFMRGDFLNDDTKIVFYLSRDKSSENIEVRLLFIMNGNHMSPELFFDVLTHPGLTVMSPRAIELYSNQNGHIYISSESEKEGRKNQTWTFFTPDEKCDVSLFLQSDGKGGTFFTLLRPKLNR